MKMFGMATSVGRRLLLISAAALLVAGGLNSFVRPRADAQNVTISTAQDCDSNAVIYCGVRCFFYRS
jgi:hypothetical protein